MPAPDPASVPAPAFQSAPRTVEPRTVASRTAAPRTVAPRRLDGLRPAPPPPERSVPAQPVPYPTARPWPELLTEPEAPDAPTRTDDGGLLARLTEEQEGRPWSA